MTTLNRALAAAFLLLLVLIAPRGVGPVVSASDAIPGQPSSQAAKVDLPKEKQTSLGLYVTAKEAFEKWNADPEAVKILDVRTTEEFLFVGHAAMAWSVPLFLQVYEWDAAAGRFPMKPNPDFITQVTKVVKRADTVLVMCRSGGRSAMAVNKLAEAGFTHVYNITDGMEGDEVHDPGSVFEGQRLRNGWKNSGVPWTYDVSPERISLPKAR